jgi:streptogramin lyase
MFALRPIHVAGVALLMFGLFVPRPACALRTGDLLVCDKRLGIIAVDPSGLSQTPLVWNVGGYGYIDVVSNASGDIYALGNVAGPIVRVDPASGAVSPVCSDHRLQYSYTMDLAPNGKLYVTTSDGVARVDPTTGELTLLLPVDLPFYLGGLAIAPDGSGFVLLGTGSPSATYQLYRLDLDTGVATPVPFATVDSGDAAAADANGRIIVLDDQDKAVRRIEPSSGAITTLRTGDTDLEMVGVAVETTGNLIVVDQQRQTSCTPIGEPSTCRGRVFRIDSATGQRSLISEQGLFEFIAGVDVYRGANTTPAPATSWGQIKATYR